MTPVKYLFYHLTLESPAILSTMTGDPNSVSTLPYIPGSAVRGAVAAALGDPGSDSAKLKAFKQIVLSNSVRYLNAYPEHEGLRSLPTPVFWRRIKHNNRKSSETEGIDLSAYQGESTSLPEDEDIHGWPEEELSKIPEPFVTISEKRPTLIQPRIIARIHNQRDRQKGRAWKEVINNREVTHGAIFACESLDANQAFCGAIQIMAESEAELNRLDSQIKRSIGDLILVGRSRRAGYGGMARFSWLDPQTQEVQGARIVRDAIEPGQEFRILLTSACVGRHPISGQIDPAAIKHLIDEKLGTQAKYVRRRWEFEVIGGFNAKWRLEYPQILAAAAGSAFVYRAEQTIPPLVLRSIEHNGIGERKTEGFGRLLFLQSAHPKLTIRYPDDSEPKLQEQQAPKTVRKIEKHILMAQARREIDDKAASIAEAAVRIPTNSLIGRLRVPLRSRKGLDTLNTWLNGAENDRLKSTAMDQLDKCRLKNGDRIQLSSWLRDAIKAEKVPQWLNFNVLKTRYYIVSEQSAQKVLEKYQNQLAVRLIDTVLATLSIRNKQRQAESEKNQQEKMEAGDGSKQ